MIKDSSVSISSITDKVFNINNDDVDKLMTKIKKYLNDEYIERRNYNIINRLSRLKVSLLISIYTNIFSENIEEILYRYFF